MNVFSRSWQITKMSFGVIKKDKELLIYPILSAIFSGLYFIALMFPTVIVYLMEYFAENPDTMDQFGFEVMHYVIMFLTYLGLAFLSTFFNVCVVYTAKSRFEGSNATLGSAFKFAFSKIHLIFMWSMVSATVGLLLSILDGIAEKIGGIGEAIIKLIRGALGLAWSILTLFVVPSLVFYDLSPFKAIKKSGETLSKTWGESLIRHIGFGVVKFLLTIVGILLTILVGYLTFSVFTLEFLQALLITLGFFIIYIVILMLVFSVAKSVYNTALFIYADTGKIPKGYNKEMMNNAFKVKGTKK